MTMNIGFIGGGQMGEALIKGLIQAGVYKAKSIIVAEPSRERRKYLQEAYKVDTCSLAPKVWQSSKTVILAVKPQVMQQVLSSSKNEITEDHLIITIAAGLPIAFYEQLLDRKQVKIIRVMPNTPALVLEGASAICGNTPVEEEDLQKALTVFNAIGKAVVLEEQYLDAVTGLSGSGPAYVFTFIDALIDAGLKTGLTRDIAQTLALQTILGSVKLMQETKEHPAVLRSRVTSPGGTTIAGLHVLEKEGFRGIIMDAVEAAAKRSTELGKK